MEMRAEVWVRQLHDRKNLAWRTWRRLEDPIWYCGHLKFALLALGAIRQWVSIMLSPLPPVLDLERKSP